MDVILGSGAQAICFSMRLGSFDDIRGEQNLGTLMTRISCESLRARRALRPQRARMTLFNGTPRHVGEKKIARGSSQIITARGARSLPSARRDSRSSWRHSRTKVFFGLDAIEAFNAGRKADPSSLLRMTVDSACGIRFSRAPRAPQCISPAAARPFGLRMTRIAGAVKMKLFRISIQASL